MTTACIAGGNLLFIPAASAASSNAIDTTSYSAAAKAYADIFLPTQSVPIGWTGSVDGCKAGAISDAAQKATFTAINYFRGMAGLDRVTENTAQRASAQSAALLRQANPGGFATPHQPPRTAACWTQAGYEASTTGNLVGPGANGPGARAIDTYVDDFGSSNINAGHRSWIFKVNTAQMAAGSTSLANALRVVGQPQNPGATNPGWMSWPTKGYFPAALKPDGPWSVMFDTPGADFSRATVTVKRGTTTLPTTVLYRSGTGAGEVGVKSMTFRVSGITVPVADEEVVYTVTVQGVRGLPAGAPSPYTYQVKMFKPAVKPLATPVISGNLAVGQPLRVGTLTWSTLPTLVTYQWLRDGAAIPGAVAATYTPTIADAGHRISVKVTGSKANSAGKATAWLAGSAVSAQTSPVVAPAVTPVVPLKATTKPVIAGTATAGKALTVAPATWNVTPAAVTYQWYRGATAIAGATAMMYAPTAADLGATLTVRATATKTGYAVGVADSAPVGPVVAEAQALVASGPVVIVGTPALGQSLTVAPITWNAATPVVGYQWLRGGQPIAGATGASYRLTATDVDATLTVRATATKSGYLPGTAESATLGPIRAGTNAAYGTPQVSGNPTVGQVLTAAAPSYQVTPDRITYLWLRGGQPIPGATGAQYQLSAADAGKTVSVQVAAATSGYHTTTITSAAVGPVVLGTTTLTVAVAFDAGWLGTATTHVDSPCDAQLTYQWFRGGEPIKNQTGPTYQAGWDDAGQVFTAHITATHPACATATAVSDKVTLPAPTGGFGG